MGFGVSGSTAVIFLGVLIASGTLYTAAAGSAEQISEARDGHGEDLLDRRNTELAVTSVVYNDASSALEIEIVNTGETTLSVNGTSVLVDNEYQQPIATAVESDANPNGDGQTDVWGATQTLVIDVQLSAQPDRVTVVAENGVAASNSTVEVS